MSGSFLPDLAIILWEAYRFIVLEGEDILLHSRLSNSQNWKINEFSHEKWVHTQNNSTYPVVELFLSGIPYNAIIFEIILMQFCQLRGEAY